MKITTISTLRVLSALLIITALTACGGATTKVTVNVVGEGRVTSPSGIDCGTRCEVTVRLNNEVPTATGTMDITAIPEPGNRLLGWNYGDCDQSNNCTLQLEQYCAIGMSPLSETRCSVWDSNTYIIKPVFVRDADVMAQGWSPYTSCAIFTNMELRCWNSYGESSEVPTVSNPTQVVTEKTISCVEDDSGVQCWGAHSRPTYYCPAGVTFPSDQCEVIYPERPPLPDLYPPLTLAAGDGFVCALDVMGVKCWSGYGDTLVPELINPTNIRTVNRKICVDDVEGTVCWTRNFSSE